MPEGVPDISVPGAQRKKRASSGHAAHNWPHRVRELEACFQAVMLAKTSHELGVQLLWLRAMGSTWAEALADLLQRSLP